MLLKDVARIELGPDEHRGITELNRKVRWQTALRCNVSAENALDVIDNVKARLADMASALPKGVEIIPVYDRSNLIYDAIAGRSSGRSRRRASSSRSSASCSCCMCSTPGCHHRVPG